MTDLRVIGRERELEVLDAVVAAASSEGAALVLAGEPGIGKSALLGAAAVISRANGCTVLRALRPEERACFAGAGFARLAVSCIEDHAGDGVLRTHVGRLSAAVLGRIRQAAQGNPLALQELPRSWGDGPATDDHPVAVTA